MQFGLILDEQPTTVPAREHFDSLFRQVEAAQRAGFRWLVVGHHFVVPDGNRWLQPVPLLARLAAEVDADVRLVPWVLIAPVYPPVLLAEELATLDIVTGGRLTVGLGVGYRRDEYEAFGIPFEERNARLEEGIAILKAMWTSDRVSYEGRFTTLRDVAVHLRPLQSPHPPLLIGAQTPGGIRRAARLADGWAVSRSGSLEVLRDRFTVYAQALAAEGKPMTPQSFRQDVLVAKDPEQGLRQVRTMLTDGAGPIGRVGAGPAGGRGGEARFIVGSASDCAAQLMALASEFPVDPIIVRAKWPSTTTADAVAYLELIGRELLPLVRGHRPAPSYPVL